VATSSPAGANARKVRIQRDLDDAAAAERSFTQLAGFTS
jgi:hypothetical protein